ncbi:hypothetical protein FBD94_15355 [Pedobacter hiemivivus]|uniref:RHS repeat protein n=1 Tax=Pedobacter hiemivivus TaxID=2530454 RepID=A0A4U1G8W9_9SPHI|nr:hypothetical protein [Pedobacter hiemivivus]TKC60281.1 hypothetical protein FBD94_15355 [Pedobacter hiemivivus]
MKRYYYLLIFLLLSGVELMAQENSIGLPSPNNRFLGIASAGAEIGVDLYTGTAQINIPVTSLSSGQMTIPVSLSYVGARGIKIQDYASQVGLGWQLNAGGSITRVVRGFPDDSSNGYLGGYWGYLGGYWAKRIGDAIRSNSALPEEVSPHASISGGFLGIGGGIKYKSATADGEPDIFYIKTPFFSAQFVFDEDGKPVFSNSTNLRITTYSGECQNGFIAIDGSGTQYYFGTSPSSVEKNGNSYISSWYLDKIVSANQAETINFEYATGNTYNLKRYYSVIYNVGSDCEERISRNRSIDIVEPKYLSKIITEKGQVKFNYLFDRKDISYYARLASVDVMPANMIKEQSYHFDYNYFGTDENDFRLCLDQIRLKYSKDTKELPYKKFTYNRSLTLPAPTSDQFDFWGYYTLFPSGEDPLVVPSIREPNEVFAKTNVLTKVSDLANGETTISYGLNTYYDVALNQNKFVGGLRVTSISKQSPNIPALSVNYIYDDAGRSTGQILTNTYANLQVNTCSGWRNNHSESQSLTHDVNGNFVGYSKVKVLSGNGGYTVSNFTNFSDFPDKLNSISTLFSMTPNVVSSISNAYKRGLPLSETIFTASGNKISENLYEYAALNSTIENKAYGVRTEIIMADCGGTQCTSEITSRYWTNVENYRLVKTIQRNYDQLEQNNYAEVSNVYTYHPNKFQINNVRTTDSKGNIINKTSYYLGENNIPMLADDERSAHNVMRESNITSVLIHEKSTKNDIVTQVHYTYGILKNKTINLISSASYIGNQLVDQKHFEYDVNSRVIATKDNYGLSNAVGYDKSNMPVVKISNAINNKYVSYTDNYVKRTKTVAIPLVAAVNWAYYPSSPSSINKAEYKVTFTMEEYGEMELLSFGSPYQNWFADYTIFKNDCWGSILQSGGMYTTQSGDTQMDNSWGNNYKSQPDRFLQIPKTINLEKGSYTIKLYDVICQTAQHGKSPAGELKFSYRGIDLVSRDSIITGKSEFFYEGFEPKTVASDQEIIKAYSGRGYHTGKYRVPFKVTDLVDGVYYLISYRYYSKGSWIGVSKLYYDNMILQDGIAVDYISIVPLSLNRPSNEYYFQDFEDQPAPPVVPKAIPYAGKGGHHGVYRVPFDADPNRRYKIDYYYYADGNWNYKIKDYYNNMTLEDGTDIDEVRVYPEDALITTYTFDPFFGKTSETDSFGNTTFYEYDGLGRVIHIRDRNRNIVQKFEHHYKDQ